MTVGKLFINGKEVEPPSSGSYIEEIGEIDKRSSLSKNYSYDRWCSLIAFLINCDYLAYAPNKEPKTSKDIFNSNPYGELVFIGSCIQLLEHFLVKDGIFEDKEKNKVLFVILDGNDVDPSIDYATGLGLKCVTILWKTSDEFEEQVNELLGL